MPQLNRSELVSGAIVVVIGACFALGATEYRMGTVTRMGPGFIPLSVGVIMIGIGILIAISALGEEGGLPSLDFRGLICVGLSVAAFAVLLPRTGLVPATMATVIISSRAVPALRWPVVGVLAAAVALGAYLVFVVMLGISIPVLRNPF